MAFPYGGSMTHAELAKKFGWPSVIISIILIPLTWLFSRLLAFPVFFCTKWKFTLENTIKYGEGHEDVFREKVYETPERVTRSPSGWDCHVDAEGGTFFEKFWGIINCLDIEVKDNRFIINPNSYSWLMAKVFVEFPEKPNHEHRIRFYFPLNGLNKFNPFAWLTMAYVVTALTWYGKYSFEPFKEAHGLVTESVYFPPELEAEKLRKDGSLPYETPTRA